MPHAKVFLVGFMGTGKTTLGRLLAERLGWEFGDVDEVIERTTGSTIVRIFLEKGEPYFREIERAVLADLAGSAGRTIIACGGGTFCSVGNQTLMERCGITVWLDQPFEQIWQRREMLAVVRPLVQNEDELRDLYDRRLPFYRQATIHLAVEENGITDALIELLSRLRDGGHID